MQWDPLYSAVCTKGHIFYMYIKRYGSLGKDLYQVRWIQPWQTEHDANTEFAKLTLLKSPVVVLNGNLWLHTFCHQAGQTFPFVFMTATYILAITSIGTSFWLSVMWCCDVTCLMISHEMMVVYMLLEGNQRGIYMYTCDLCWNINSFYQCSVEALANNSLTTTWLSSMGSAQNVHLGVLVPHDLPCTL